MSSRNPSRPPAAGEPVRLQVFLSRAGIASRRAAEELIAAGRVTVNGAPVTAPGTKVRPGLDRIEVDGRRAGLNEVVWLALHKPKGYVTSRLDQFGRKTIYELLPEKYHSLFHVGRLDRDSDGLLLLTNDGGGANRMLHPRYGVTKEYHADVMGSPTSEELRRLTEGVELDDGTVARAEAVRRLHQVDVGVFRVLLVLQEGKKREVRRMMDAIGHPVRRLTRRRFGPVSLGELRSGTWRVVAPSELASVLEGAERRDADTGAPAAEGTGGDAPPRRRKPAAEGERPARKPAAPRKTARPRAGGAEESAPRPRRKTGDAAPRRGAGDGPPSRPRRPAGDDAPRGRRPSADDAPRPRRAASDDAPARPRRASRDEAPSRPRRAPSDDAAPRSRRPVRDDAAPRARRDAGDDAPRPRRGPGGDDAPRARRPSTGDAPRSRRPATEGDAPRRTSAGRPARPGDGDSPRRKPAGRSAGWSDDGDDRGPRGKPGGSRPAKPPRGGSGPGARPGRRGGRPSGGKPGPRRGR